MSVILFTEKPCRPKLPILPLCYATTTFYRLPVPTCAKHCWAAGEMIFEGRQQHQQHFQSLWFSA